MDDVSTKKQKNNFLWLIMGLILVSAIATALPSETNPYEQAKAQVAQELAIDVAFLEFTQGSHTSLGLLETVQAEFKSNHSRTTIKAQLYRWPLMSYKFSSYSINNP